MIGTGRIVTRRQRRSLALSFALVALLVGCSEEAQEEARDRVEGAIEDADLEGSELPIDGTDAAEPGAATEEAEADAAAEEEEPEAAETEAEEEPEATESETDDTEAVAEAETGTDADTEAAVATGDTPTYGWALLLGLIVVAVSAVAIGNHRQSRREATALRDRALIDVDWLLSASTDRPLAEEVVTRTLDVRARADRAHDALGALAARCGREDGVTVLRLRDDVAALATMTLQRYGNPGSENAALDIRLGEQRERVRSARLAVSNASR